MTALFAVLLVAWLEPTTPATSTEASEPHAAPHDAHGAISGVVTNTRTKAKVAGAHVVLRGSDGTERRTVTGESGLYTFRELPAAEYTVEVQHGRTTVAKIFSLERDQKFRANFSLDPESPGTRTVRVKSTPVTRSSPATSSRDTRICCFGSRRSCRWARALERAERQKARQDSRAERRRARRES